MYYKVIIKDFVTFRYAVLADSPKEARELAREHHRHYYPNGHIERVTISNEYIDDVVG